jgi:hypothetical protein
MESSVITGKEENGNSKTPDDLHELLHGNPAELTKPIKSVQDKWRLVPAFLKVLGSI